MSERIRLCPWCSSEPKVEVIDGDWCVYCDTSKCAVEPFTFDHDRSKAIDNWNARPGEAISGAFNLYEVKP